MIIHHLTITTLCSLYFICFQTSEQSRVTGPLLVCLVLLVLVSPAQPLLHRDGLLQRDLHLPARELHPPHQAGQQSGQVSKFRPLLHLAAHRHPRPAHPHLHLAGHHLLSHLQAPERQKEDQGC